MKLKLAIFTLLCSVGLAACAKLDAPQPGRYRAALNLKGGEAPLMLQIANEGKQLRLSLLNGDEPLVATDLRVENGALHALLPNVGELQAKFRSNALSGEWRVTDAQGKTTVIPFDAKLNANYRFVAKPLTDNADVSGSWTLDATPLSSSNSAHNAMPPALQLAQTHDAVDGTLAVPGSDSRAVFGQVQGDDVYLTAIGAEQVLLFKGKVNAQGNLEGKVWINLDEAQNWSAKRSVDQPAASSFIRTDATRQVAFPWAIPTQ